MFAAPETRAAAPQQCAASAAAGARPPAAEHSLAEALRLYERMSHSASLRLTSRIRAQRPADADAALLHISNLVESGGSVALFTVGHELVELRADWPLAWYAVAAYYYAIHRFDQARVYLDKCLGMCPTFGAGWLMLGHSFAAHDEHDRAMNCYIKAAKVLPSHFYPLLYIGLTYLTTRNVRMAERFLAQAYRLAGGDDGAQTQTRAALPQQVHTAAGRDGNGNRQPLVMNEMGVLSLRSNDCDKALAFFQSALAILLPHKDDDGDGDHDDRSACGDYAASRSARRCRRASALRRRLRQVVDARWEPILNNAAHACRLLERYDEAIAYHQKSLLLRPKSASTYLGLAMCHALTLDLETCIELLHSAAASSSGAQGTGAALPQLAAGIGAVAAPQPPVGGMGPQPVRAALDAVMRLYSMHPDIFVGRASSSSVRGRLWLGHAVPHAGAELADALAHSGDSGQQRQQRRSGASDASGSSPRSVDTWRRVTRQQSTNAAADTRNNNSSGTGGSVMDVTA